MEEKREIIYSDISSASRKQPYDAMVYLEGTSVIAVDSNGKVIAKGTAGTDDATVIQAAEAEGDNVLISPGTYSFSANYTFDASTSLTFEPGATFKTSAVGVKIVFQGPIRAGLYKIFEWHTSETWTNSNPPFQLNGDCVPTVFPQWWGVSPDASPGPTFGMQFCIASLYNTGGVITYPPHSTPYVHENVSINHNGNSLAIIGYGAIAKYNGSWGATDLNGFFLISADNVTIEGLTIDGDKSTLTYPTYGRTKGIYTTSAHSNINIIRCIIQNFTAHGIYLSFSTKSNILYNYIDSNDLNGIDTGGSNYCNIEGNVVLASGAHGIDVDQNPASPATDERPIGVRVINNYVVGWGRTYADPAETDGITMSGSEDFSDYHDLSRTNVCCNNVLEHVAYDGMTANTVGIRIIGNKGTICAGNTIYGNGACKYGITVDNRTCGGIVANNVIQDVLAYGIYSGYSHIKDVKICNNVIYSDGTGIGLIGSANVGERIHIRDNIITCVGHGIIYRATDAVISGNDIHVVNTTGATADVYGIYAYSTNSNDSIIANSVDCQLSLSGATGTPRGIYSETPTGTIRDNTVNIVFANSGGGNACYALEVTSATAVHIRGNTLTSSHTFCKLPASGVHVTTQSYDHRSYSNLIGQTVIAAASLKGLWPFYETGYVNVIHDRGPLASNLTSQGYLNGYGHGTIGLTMPYLAFNGSSQYLYRTNDTNFDFGNGSTDSAFSVLVCVNPDAVTSRQIIGKWDENGARAWRVFLDANGYPTVQLYDESAGKYIGRQVQTALATDTWAIIAATYDGSGTSAGCKIYLDGIQVDDADYEDAGYTAMEAVSANLTVGALKNNTTYTQYYDGDLAWLEVTGGELTANHIWSVVQLLKGEFGI